MIKSGITATILFLGMAFLALPTTARAVELISNDPATTYYTTNGEDPTSTIDSMTTTLPESGASASLFDDYYTIASTDTIWDGIDDPNRLRLPTADYASTYGDEASVTYTLPWTFTFYGQLFTQITADTNGNVWFGSSSSAHSFNLTTNGHGPVIAAWNNDLSSYLTGGVFVQHKSSPERVVVEWQTETYTDEGRRRPHNFEVVLFQTGDIRLDYGSFTTSTTNADFGSGVSLNDGSMYVNITSSADNIYSLGGQSFLLTVTGTTKALTVWPTGGGSVTSNVGALWTAVNTKSFPTGAHIVLTAVPRLGYRFDYWSSLCSGTGPCSFTLAYDYMMYAFFSYDAAQNSAVIFPNGSESGYSSLQAAYNAALTDSILKLRAATFSETISFNQTKSVTIKGGYNNDYTANNAGQSIVSEKVTIASGKVLVDGLTIR